MTAPGNAASPIETVDEMHAALRLISEKGLPFAPDLASAKDVLDRALWQHGLDFRNNVVKIFLRVLTIEEFNNGRLLATRWAIDMHLGIPRSTKYNDPVGAIMHGLHLIKKYLQPSEGMNLYISSRAKILIRNEICRACEDHTLMPPLLKHAISMFNADKIALPFSEHIPTLEIL